MGFVYLVTSPSNKQYIGITKYSVQERWNKHVKRSYEKKYYHAIHNSIRKYGKDSFKLEVLFESDSWEELCEKEKFFIKEKNTLYPNGYNLTEGGEGIVGRVVTEESRKRISEAQKKRYQNPEQREKLKQYGKIAANNSKQAKKIREVDRKKKQKTYLSSPEFKELHSNATKEGMKRVKEVLLQKAKERSESPTWRLKISESKKGQGLGRKLPEEQKEKMRQARKAWWENKKQNQQICLQQELNLG